MNRKNENRHLGYAPEGAECYNCHKQLTPAGYVVVVGHKIYATSKKWVKCKHCGEEQGETKTLNYKEASLLLSKSVDLIPNRRLVDLEYLFVNRS